MGDGMYLIELLRTTTVTPQEWAKERERVRQEKEQRERERSEQFAAAREAQIEEQQRLAAKAQKQVEERARELKSGKVKISSFADAGLVYEPNQGLDDIMDSPRLVPDKGYYSGSIIVDGQHSRNVLRGKRNASIYFGTPFGVTRPDLAYGLAYIFLRISSKTINYTPGNLRIGATITVLGRYVGNMQYTTIGGEPKIAPLLEVAYICSAVESSSEPYHNTSAKPQPCLENL